MGTAIVRFSWFLFMGVVNMECGDYCRWVEEAAFPRPRVVVALGDVELVEQPPSRLHGSHLMSRTLMFCAFKCDTFLWVCLL